MKIVRYVYMQAGKESISEESTVFYGKQEDWQNLIR